MSDVEAGAWKIAAFVAAILLFILLLKPNNDHEIQPQQTVIDTVYVTDTVFIHDTVFKNLKKPVVKDTVNSQIDTTPISNET